MFFLTIFFISFVLIFTALSLSFKSLPPIDRELDPNYIMRPQKWVGHMFLGLVSAFLSLLVSVVIFILI
jgi:hypothetical protein